MSPQNIERYQKLAKFILENYTILATNFPFYLMKDARHMALALRLVQYIALGNDRSLAR